MSEVPSDGEQAEEHVTTPLAMPVVEAWSVPSVPGSETSGEHDTQVLEPEPVPRPRRRWLRRTLVSLVCLLVIAGLVTGSMAYLDHRQEVRHKKEVAARLAAAKKAEAAYIAAVKPLVLRVFDAVQPIQDVADAFAHPRPGLLGARDDVLRSGGALRELKAVSLALARLKVPAAYVDTASPMKQSLDALTNVVTGLEGSTHEKPDEDGYVTSYGFGFEWLLRAEINWQGEVAALPGALTWAMPDAGRAKAHGRSAPTAGGFIMASDLACGKATAAAEFEPYHTAAQAAKTLGKLSKAVKTAVSELRRVPTPPTQRPYRHTLDIGWSATLGSAADMDRLVAAYRRHDQVAVLKALQAFKESLKGMADLGSAYGTRGIRECGLFFSDGETSPKKGSTTTRA